MQHANTVDYIVKWLKTYAADNRLKGFVIGISGGIDSALTSTLCARTDLPVCCVEMPIHQAADQVSRAQNHITWLQAKYPKVENFCVDLSASFDTLKAELQSATIPGDQHLALANTRARLRMTTLYYYAGLQGYAVAGTGNKIEDFGIGFYTKYGDGGVDLSPIADLTKTEVFALSAFLNINSEILQAAPTDGLFGDNRSDEAQIGATYPELEWAMKAVENGKSEADFEGRELEVFKIFSHRHRINQHKWSPIPVCKIPTAFKVEK